MKNIAIAEVDIVIVGGGIAGLWLLNRLRQLGYAVVLLEAKALGGGQTCVSQGIIHGGMKYALQGAMTEASQRIADMPKVWSDCLNGTGIINLSHVSVLSEFQYLWSTHHLTSKLAGFFSSLALKSNVQSLSREDFPEVFQHPDFRGHVYSLNEMVIDIHSLVHELVKPNQDVIYKVNPLTEDALKWNEKNQLDAIEIQAGLLDPVQVKAQRFIFTAGNGNEILHKKLNHPAVKMQKRPLHMVVAKTDLPYSVYAHCLGLGTTPRMTITTHKAQDGKMIWYLGGQIAEEGIKRTAEEQIAIARKELQTLFSWLDFSTMQLASFFVDRAEAWQSDGKRPDSCYAYAIQNTITAWPTKLAFAPKLANEIVDQLKRDCIQPACADIQALQGWPVPVIVKPIWDELL